MRRVVAGIAVAAAAACAAEDGPRPATVERDSAGIAIVEHRGGAATWRLGIEPIVRIGVLDGNPAQQFHGVAFAGRLTDGAIVAVDAGSREVRWFDRAGRHLYAAGRRGSGPAEFSAITDVLLLAGDTVLVHDARNQRLTWLHDGIVIREATILAGYGARVLRAWPDGRALVARSQWKVEGLRAGYNYRRELVDIVLHSAGGEHSLARLPGRETAIWTRTDEAGRITATVDLGLPFGRPTLVAALADGIATVGGQLELLDDTGAPHRFVRQLDSATRAVSAGEIERYVAHARERARALGRQEPAAAERNARELLALLPRQHERPPHDRMLVAVDGRIWLRDFLPPWADDAPQSWLVLEPTGVPVARVATPPGLEIHHAACDHVTGVVRDDLGVEYVAVYAIER